MNVRNLWPTTSSWCAAIATTCLLGTPLAAHAGIFSQQEVESNQFVLVASPYNNNSAHQLMILEQLSNTKACWQEIAGPPTLVDPLLANFDFTGICGRSIDSNGYSIRLSGEDFALKYSVRILNRDNSLYLIGVPYTRALPELLIGRADGYNSGFVKLNLEAGWRLTRRTYQGRSVGHIYLTNDQPLETLLAPPANNISTPNISPSTILTPPTPGDPATATPPAVIEVPVTPGNPAQPSQTAPIPVPIPVPNGGNELPK